MIQVNLLPKELQRAAHTLKGSSSHFFATHVVSTAEILENYGEQGEFDNAPEAFENVKVEVDRLIEAIRAKFLT